MIDLELKDFHNIHVAETCLLLGNGPSLNDVPLGLLDAYKTIGSNTIFMSGFIPSYYTAVDTRVRLEFSEEINTKYRDVPKFLPYPNLDLWKGENIVRWLHRPGALWPYSDIDLLHTDMLSDQGITYSCVMHVQMQIAFFMGFDRFLCVGMDHTIHTKEHFWGRDDNMPSPAESANEKWAAGYKELRIGMDPVEIINISTKTELSPDDLPRGDWRDYTP